MRVRIIPEALAIVIGFCFLSMVPHQGCAQEKLWTISERKLPVPSAASDSLQRFLQKLPAPDVDAARRNVPAGEAEWKKIIREKEAVGATRAGKLAERMSVTVQREKIAGVTVRRVVPAKITSAHRRHVFVHLHGGAYVFNGGGASVYEAILIAYRAGIPVLCIDYRMPPEHPFPAAVDDVVSVYRELLKNRPPGSIALGGTSAGGGLTLASVHRFRQLGLPMPGALFAGTPWADLIRTGDSLFTNEGVDHVLITYDGLLMASARFYAGRQDLKDPLISPVYGRFEGFPPTYLVTGTRDLFLSDTVRVHRKLRRAHVPAELNVYEGVSHADYLFLSDSPESEQAYAELGEFLTRHLRRVRE